MTHQTGRVVRTAVLELMEWRFNEAVLSLRHRSYQGKELHTREMAFGSTCDKATR